jgi:hypothetical protein
MAIVIVYPPDEDDGRRVQADGVILGRAFSLLDVVAFMQEAGMHDWNEMDVVRSEMIEWRGGGPEVWTA